MSYHRKATDEQRIGPWVCVVYDDAGFIDRIYLFTTEAEADEYAAAVQAGTDVGRSIDLR